MTEPNFQAFLSRYYDGSNKKPPILNSKLFKELIKVYEIKTYNFDLNSITDSTIEELIELFSYGIGFNFIVEFQSVRDVIITIINFIFKSGNPLQTKFKNEYKKRLQEENLESICFLFEVYLDDIGLTRLLELIDDSPLLFDIIADIYLRGMYTTDPNSNASEYWVGIFPEFIGTNISKFIREKILELLNDGYFINVIHFQIFSKDKLLLEEDAELLHNNHDYKLIELTIEELKRIGD